MTVTIKPSQARGRVVAPPSKSMAHRALICAALSKKSVVENVSFSNDISATLDCLKTLGARVEICDNGVCLGGLCLENIPENITLDCGESGSTLRFLLPLCMACNKTVILKGAKRLFERPLTIYEDIAEQQNILFEKGENFVKVCGALKSGEYEIAGNISSQFISGLLFLLPLVLGESKITVTGNFESASYVDLTLCVLKDFGVRVTKKENVFEIFGAQEYKENNYIVEADCSNAAFLEAFNYLGGQVQVLGLNPNTLQGDRVFKQFFEQLKNGQKRFDLADCPDLAPVMFAVSAVFGGAEFFGTKRLKIKESDRAEAMKRELLKFGIEAEIGENSVTVKGGNLKAPKFVLNSHNDHRIAMALSMLLSVTGGSISDAQAVEKSYPNFYETIKSIGIDVNEID